MGKQILSIFGKQILSTLGWIVIQFVLLATGIYLAGIDDWHIKILIWIIPSAIGFFCGYFPGYVIASIDAKR